MYRSLSIKNKLINNALYLKYSKIKGIISDIKENSKSVHTTGIINR